MGKSKQREISDFERVDVRLKIPKYKRDKLNILSAIQKTTMNNLLESLIDEAISNSEEMKKLESSGKKRYSLKGLTSGSTFTDEDIDEARKAWEKQI
ncbi:hypothetical protein FJZ33_04860 [Candidatus Poribacteria bacterium]|nr:hypothetical protein [Candidatus Poribacteria bacterium]